MHLVFVLASVLAGFAADDVPKDQARAAELAALVKEYETAYAEWTTPGQRTTPGDPDWIAGFEKNPNWTYAPRFIAFAEANPKDDAALDAALQVLDMGRAADKALFSHYLRALNLLTQEHLQNPKVVRAILRNPTHSGSLHTEPYFQALLTASHDREIQARALMALKACYKMRIHNATDPILERPEDSGDLWRATKYLVDRLHPDYLHYIRSTDVEALSQERDRLLERVISDYAEIPVVPSWESPERQKLAKGRTLGDVAKEELNALRAVSKGMPSPEIEGTDVNGNPMKLSNFRGKVVVIVFWGNWCGQCDRFLPSEKALVERLKDHPFVLLGVNSDKDREMVKTKSREKGITWRSWFDGGGTGGPIATQWNIHGWPSIVVIDQTGVIRARGLPWSAPKFLDELVDSLLAAK